jgi:hypothetical protein
MNKTEKTPGAKKRGRPARKATRTTESAVTERLRIEKAKTDTLLHAAIGLRTIIEKVGN